MLLDLGQPGWMGEDQYCSCCKGMMGGGMMMHKKMDQRVDMLERMLQQMIEREAAQASVEQR